MLIPIEKLLDKYKLDIQGVLHVGAHHAEELEAYEAIGVPLVVWIEGDEDSHAVVKERIAKLPHHRSFMALLDEYERAVEFNVANNGQSSSVLEFGTHSKHHPEVSFVDKVKRRTRTLDAILEANRLAHLNFWNLDVQGLELRVLKGAKKALNGCDYIYTEVNAEEVYVGGALIEEIDAFLTEFERVETEWTPFKWGDAFYIRKDLL